MQTNVGKSAQFIRKEVWPSCCEPGKLCHWQVSQLGIISRECRSWGRNFQGKNNLVQLRENSFLVGKGGPLSLCLPSHGPSFGDLQRQSWVSRKLFSVLCSLEIGLFSTNGNWEEPLREDMSHGWKMQLLRFCTVLAYCLVGRLMAEFSWS